MLQSLAPVEETVTIEITYHPDLTSVSAPSSLLALSIWTLMNDDDDDGDDDHQSRSINYVCFEIAKLSQEF